MKRSQSRGPAPSEDIGKHNETKSFPESQGGTRHGWRHARPAVPVFGGLRKSCGAQVTRALALVLSP